jgi:hypothetical protein
MPCPGYSTLSLTLALYGGGWSMPCLGYSTLSLTLALYGGGWSTPCPGYFTRSKVTQYSLYRGWVGPTADLDGCGKSRSHRNSIPGPSSLQGIAMPTKLSRPTKAEFTGCIKRRTVSVCRMGM